MNYSILALFVCFICSVFGSDPVPVQSCDEDGDYPVPASFTLLGCVTPPCPFVRGTDANANITFRIPEDTNSATVDIKAKVAGFWVPFAPPDNNVCHFLTNSYCPLDKDEVVIYNMIIAVQKFYPTISLKLKVKLLDENKKIMACMQVDCKVVKK